MVTKHSAEGISLKAFITLMAMQLTLVELTVAEFVAVASYTFVIASYIAATSFLIIFKHFFVDLKLNP